MTYDVAPRLRERVDWVDAAKGMSITLVVLFHSTLIDATPPNSGPWWAVNAVFATLRMPLFFLASGLFATSALRRSWPELLRGRVLLLVYVYVLWLTVRRLYFALLEGRIELTLQDYLLPDSDMWFLYVLAVFFVLARALRRVPARVQIGVAAVVSILVGSLAFERELYRFDDMAVYFVFFLAGCHWSRPIRDRVGALTAPTAVASVVVFLLLTGAVTVLGLREVPPFRFVLSVAALAAGLSFAVFAVRVRLGAVLVHVGRNSLPIYVLHMIFIRTATHLDGRAGVELQSVLVGPLVLTLLGVSGSLAAHFVLRRVPGLFEAPAWLQRALGSRRRAQVSEARP